MEPVLLIVLVGLIGGLAVGAQGPLASLLTQRLGVWESIFIIHFGGTMMTLVPLAIIGGGKLAQWRSVPWYALGAGFFGLVVLASVSFTIPRIGVAAAIVTIVAGQLVLSAVLDHFGLLGASVRPLDAPRLLGLSVVMLGVWLTVR